MFYAYKNNDLICGSEKKETVIKICKNLNVSDYEITDYEKIIPKSEAELEAEQIGAELSEAEAEIAELKEQILTALALYGEGEIVNELRAELISKMEEA